MATIKVNLSKVGNACEQDETPPNSFPSGGWYAFLQNCNGTPFVNAGKEYGPFPMDHGYVEIKDVPPGRYLLFAMENPFPIGGKPIPGGEVLYQANYVSHFAIVEICCRCEEICVILYNSGWHYCVQVIIYWFELLALTKQMDPKIANAARDALSAAVRSAGKTFPTDEGIIRHLEKFHGKIRQEK